MAHANLQNDDHRATRCAIIGGGIGGLAAAIALHDIGCDVRVFEQSVQFAEIGAGIQISANGMRVLDALGVGQGLRRSGVALEAVALQDGLSAKHVLRLDLTKLAPRGHFLALHRADLHAALREGVSQRRIKIDCARQIDAPEAIAGFIDAEGGFRREFDLVIAADGVRSVHRGLVMEDAEAKFTGQVAWRALVTNLHQHPPIARVAMAPGQHVVTYPVRNQELVNIVAVEENAHWCGEGWAQAGDLTAFQERFLPFGGDLRDLFAQISDVKKWGLFDHNVPQIWGKGRLILLGDAAHPMLPFLAQGATMAIEDAIILARILKSEKDMTRITNLYSAARCARVRRVLRTVRANARRYHLRNPLVRASAHLALRAADHLAPNLMARGFDWLYQYDPVNAPLPPVSR